jgi:integrase/recombinase XerD
MSGKKGYQATQRLRERSLEKRGGPKRDEWPQGELGSLCHFASNYLMSLAVKNLSPLTIKGREDSLRVFMQWASQRELTAQAITKPILESYQRHIYRYRKADGKALGFASQRIRISAVRDLFAWLTKQNHLQANPASELELPRPEKRLPAEALSVQQVQALLAVPDPSDLLGIRDRAMLELFYSTGIRRSELSKLALTDLYAERGTLRIRQGKGHKDRVVPVGSRALQWLARYLEQVRPRLVVSHEETHLFLSSYGEPFNPDVLSHMVSKWLKQIELGRPGSCHLLRHTCATHLLEGGADIRYIQQLLGHENLETTAIYTQVSIEQLKAVHARCHPAENPLSPKKASELESRV